MRRSSLFLLIFLIVAFSLPRDATPCGICKGDDRAAVYSHDAMEMVKADPKRLEFLVVKVRGNLDDDAADEVTAWLGKRREVRKETVKASSSQKSVGFVFKRRYDRAKFLDALHRSFPQLIFEVIGDTASPVGSRPSHTSG